MNPILSFESPRYYKLSIESRLLYVKFITDFRKRFVPGIIMLHPVNHYRQVCMLNGYRYQKRIDEIIEARLIFIDKKHAYLPGLVRYFMEYHEYSLPRGYKLEHAMSHSFGRAWKEEFDDTLNDLPDEKKDRIMIKLGLKLPDKPPATAAEILIMFAEEHRRRGHGEYYVGSVPELSQAARIAKFFTVKDIKHRMCQFFDNEWNVSNKKLDFLFFSRTINKYEGLLSSYEDDQNKTRYWEIVNNQKQV